ncbi:MAG: D-aminoacyl-tRNA deacylase [Bacteroidales bacterium]
MRVVIQRVKEASVLIDGKLSGKIGIGILVLLGIEESDNDNDVDWLVSKIVNLRIFPDAGKVMNLSLLDAKGSVLVVSQFTLHASTKKGNRPSYIKAAKPEIAIPLYQSFVRNIERLTLKKPETGEFGAMMEVSLINDGPVTIIIDSKNKE